MSASRRHRSPQHNERAEAQNTCYACSIAGVRESAVVIAREIDGFNAREKRCDAMELII
jgi:hypothetical protein